VGLQLASFLWGFTIATQSGRQFSLYVFLKYGWPHPRGASAWAEFCRKCIARGASHGKFLKHGQNFRGHSGEKYHFVFNVTLLGILWTACDFSLPFFILAACCLYCFRDNVSRAKWAHELGWTASRQGGFQLAGAQLGITSALQKTPCAALFSAIKMPGKNRPPCIQEQHKAAEDATSTGIIYGAAGPIFSFLSFSPDKETLCTIALPLHAKRVGGIGWKNVFRTFSGTSGA